MQLWDLKVSDFFCFTNRDGSRRSLVWRMEAGRTVKCVGVRKDVDDSEIDRCRGEIGNVREPSGHIKVASINTSEFVEVAEAS